MQRSILVIEDDKELNAYLKEILAQTGYVVNTTSEGSQALQLFKKVHPDLVVLDLGLPDVNGETICKEIKKLSPQTPVIILTAHDTTEDVVRGLNLGADDYMTKPFEPDELVARIKARLRVTSASSHVLKIADLELNTETFEVKRSGSQINLTQTEFQLLNYLMHNRDRVVTREMILNHVWAYAPDIESRVVDVYVGYLRKKIDANYDMKLLHSVRGFGYVMKES